jgi:hypothetical protein
MRLRRGPGGYATRYGWFLGETLAGAVVGRSGGADSRFLSCICPTIQAVGGIGWNVTGEFTERR